RRFELNRHWVQMLPAELRSHWEQFAPLGTFDADMTLAYDGARWKPEFTIEARDASFAYNKFPLRLTDARGKFTLRGGVLVMQNVVAHARGRPVRIDGRLANIGPDFTGYVKFDADQPIPVDQSLFEALPEQPRAIVTSLHPRGELTAHGKFERRVAGGPLEKSLDVEISSGSVQYDRFPYPVEKIAGRLRLRGERWDIVELTGHNDSAFIVCRGGWYQRPGPAAEFRIDFEATDVPLEDELKAALPPATQKIWSHANPRGTIDYVTVEVRQPPQGEKWSVNVVAQKRPATQNIDGRTLLVRPSWAPFPLDNVVGLIRYQDGRIAFEGVRAEHGRTTFQGRGVCDLFPDGRWRTHVEQVAVDRLTVDREMLVGLPAPWGQSLTKFNWNGPLNITGGLVINGSTRTNEPPTAQWDLTVDIENGSFHCGVPVEQIRGEVRLFGGGDPKSGAMQGELKLDSCLCRGVHVTQVRGPFWLTPPQVVFGDSWSQRRIADRPPRQVTAQVFGGMVATDAILSLGDELGFRVQTSVQNVDLQLVAREALPQKRDIFGRGFASLALEGTSRGVHTWRGAGKVTCRDADIQQLPVMIALIKPLAGRRADAGQSFSLSDVDFQIQGDRVYFDRIDLKGEGMTLKGRGEMTFNRVVDLQFY
ncbi:MAG TPA: hypothetical protein PLV92_18360, partial [Pirellulaceae bacterium]|nr:hypothetical protein [Pirellulaceae bacterium]